MTLIRNREDLLKTTESKELRTLRRYVLEALEHAISQMNPSTLIRKHVKIKDNFLQIKTRRYSLPKFSRVLILGAGKASCGMAKALETILGERIDSGLIVSPYGSEISSERIEILHSSHPVPDKNSLMAGKKILDVARNSKANDLVICLISGGASSLLSLPYEGISLEDLQKTNEILLKSGASIDEINSVRKHISAIKGGRLAEALYPSKVISLIISDVIDNRMDVIASGLTVPDKSTFQDALNVLKRYEIYENIPESVTKLINSGIREDIPETPKADNECFRNVCNEIIGSNQELCIFARNFLQENFKAEIVTTQLGGIARESGRELASRIENSGKNSALIFGGETTVKVLGKGKGGRNQELLLAAATALKEENIVIVAIDSDGIDGSTDAAGAIIDFRTMERAMKIGLDPEAILQDNNTQEFFQKLGDNILTGKTGTNVNDLVIAVKD